MQESTRKRLAEEYSGLDVAKMIGMEDVYMDSMRQDDEVQNIHEMFRRIGIVL